MLSSTIDAVRAVLRTDETITPPDIKKFLALLRNGGTNGHTTAPPVAPARSRIIKYAEAAERLGNGVRAVHLLAKQGLLKKVKFPGRSRSAGITQESLEALMRTTTNGAS